ncbi:MAG: hypothetical protein AAB506_01715 [Patescibacteria group bacterium]
MEKRKRKKLTHNSRRITPPGFIIWGAGALLAAVLVFNLYSWTQKEEPKRNLEYEMVSQEIGKYEEMVNKYPGYRDAYIKLAILNWKIYKNDEAKRYLEMALAIDPNNEVATSLARSWGME